MPQYNGIVLGIEEPERSPTNPTEARQAILQASRDSVLIRRCLNHATAMGLSGEDTYVWIAYWALRELQHQHELLRRTFALLPQGSILEGEKNGR